MDNMRQMKHAASVAAMHLSDATMELLSASIKQENFDTDFGIYLSQKWSEVARIRDELMDRIAEGVY